jgi:hypothetical protein
MAFLNLIPRTALLAAIALLTVLLAKATWDGHQDGKELLELTTKVSQLEEDIKDSQFAAAGAKIVNLKKLNEAKDAAKKREKQLLSDIADAKSVSDRLRITTGEARAIYSLDGTAQTPRDKLADLGYDLLERCEGKYLAMASRVEGYVGYIQELRQAWPTSQACTAKR